MSTPKVSIVVPVYNTEKYLATCVDTLINQTLKEIEIILVDDGSRQECAYLCDEIAKKDSRIRVIHKENAGAGFARNTGIDAASGEYMGFIDSDDYVDSSMFEELYRTAEKNNADIVMSGISFVDGNTFEKSGDYSEKICFEKETVFENEGIKELALGVVGALPHEPDDSRYGHSVWKNIFRRSLIADENIRFHSERQVASEDALFMVDFLRFTKKAVGIPGAYYRYRRNEVSLSKSYKKDRFEKTMAFFDVLEDHLGKYVSKDEYKLYLDRLIQGYARIICSQEIVHAVDNKIKHSVLRERLEIICANKKTAEVLKAYPWYKLPKKQAAFAFAMKYRLYYLQKLMVILRKG